MATITKIILGGHEIRFIRKQVGGVYQNVYLPHVGTNGRLTASMIAANAYVEALFTLGLSRTATIPEFKTFVDTIYVNPEDYIVDEIEFDCLTTGLLKAGDTVVHDACVIDIIAITDANHVAVKVYPLYEGLVRVTLLEYQETNFRDFQVPFRIIATSVFDGVTDDFCKLKVCKLRVESGPVIEYCTQQFEILDSNGTHLSGVISSSDWDTDLPVPNTGLASMTFVKGKTYIATAHSEGKTDTHTFTSCQSAPVVFTIQVDPKVGYINCQAYDSVTNANLSATIRIDGTTIVPKTPHTTQGLPIGSHTVTFLLDGYTSKTVTVIVEAGQTVNAYGSLIKIFTPEPEMGYIFCHAYNTVTTEPLSATVRIDGQTVAPKTPFTTPEMPVGSYTVTFIYPGYITLTKTVPVLAGKTTSAYGGMRKEAPPDVTGFDVTVNIPGLLPKTSLHIAQVVKVPLTNTWWDSPLGHGMRWDNITNGSFKARALSADSSPTPNFHTGFAANEDYAIYVGTSAISLFPPNLIYRSTDKTVKVDLTSSYIDWVSSKVCAAMDITPVNCPFFIASSVSDAAFFLELWTIITKHENLAGEPTLPTALDYALFPIAIFGMLSPGISEGKVVQTVGRRITELIPLSRKGATEIKAVMQDPSIDKFLLRATESQFKDFVRYIDDGLHINAKNLLKAVDVAPLSENDLHAIKRATNFVEALDPKLVKAGSIESIKSVLRNFSPRFADVLNNGIKWATAHPAESVMIGIGVPAVTAIAYIMSTSSINYDALVKSKGLQRGDTSWTAMGYIDVIDTYLFNVKDAEKAENWDAFCENLALWKAEVDKLKVFLLANGTTLRAEGTYDVLESSILAYYKAIELKEKVHTCVPVTLPEVINAEVIEIIDSDTVKIRYDSSDYTVRLLGVNAPEGKNYDYTCTGVRSPYLIRRLVTPDKACIEEETWTGTEELYNASKVWIGQNLPVHQIAQFKSDSTRQFDMYGRLLAIPVYDGEDICVASLMAGQSVVFFYDNNKQVNMSTFLAAEKMAKDRKVGVWAVAAGTGIIRCVSTPTAAEVWLDGEYTGKKTISNVAYLSNIPVGIHTVEFKKIIDDVSESCSKSVAVVKDETVSAECSLISDVIPPSDEKATWQIGNVKDEAGTILNAAKVYVDDIYVKHYAPELLTFCTDCSCDSVVTCGFGTHTVSIKKPGYEDWNKTRTLGSKDSFTDNPIMKLISTGTYPVTFLSLPSGATIKIDGNPI